MRKIIVFITLCLIISSLAPQVHSQETDKLLSDSSPSWSPDGSRLAFQSREAGNFDIWLVSLNGAELEYENLTAETPSNEISPAWSPTEDKIAFISDETGEWSLRMLDLSTGEMLKLAEGIAGRPVWSPNGTYLAVTHGDIENIDIEIFDSATLESQNLTTDVPELTTAFTWSPDSDALVFTITSPDFDKDGLRLIELDSQTITSLVENRSDAMPAWSPEGDLIVSSVQDGRNFDLWLTELESGNSTILVATESEGETFPVWSPDGMQIAFTSLDLKQDREDIWVINADGTGARNITAENDQVGTYNGEHVWSPQGDKIAFTSLISTAPDFDTDIWIYDVGTGEYQDVTVD